VWKLRLSTRACTCNDWQVRCPLTTVTTTHLSLVIRWRGPTRNAIFITRRRALADHTWCLLRSGFLKTRDTPTQCHPRRLLHSKLSLLTDCRRGPKRDTVACLLKNGEVIHFLTWPPTDFPAFKNVQTENAI